MRTNDTETWLKSGKYLPEPLRDFHDQKDVFKAMHELIDVKGHDYAKSVDWVSGQCYVIDIFLWWMARRGYTLQRTRRRGEYRDLAADVAEGNRQRVAHMSALMRAASTTQPPAPPTVNP
jgi:hypothetical protein